MTPSPICSTPCTRACTSAWSARTPPPRWRPTRICGSCSDGPRTCRRRTSGRSTPIGSSTTRRAPRSSQQLGARRIRPRVPAAAAARRRVGDVGGGHRPRRSPRLVHAPRRGDHARRHRAQEAPGSGARPLPSAVAGRKTRGAGPDDVGRRARTEQPAGDDSRVRRAARPAAGSTTATRRDLDAIHNAAERAARIVRNLQTFARKRHTTRTMVDLNQVVRETLALRAYEQRVANVVILDALAAGLPPVFADPHQIQQIAAEPDHQRRAGHARRARPGHADPALLARPRPRRGRPRSERRRPGRAGGRAGRRSSTRSSRRRRSARARAWD